jgi:superfamily II DNA/RNA helicase
MVLVLAPTRELASQIEIECKKFAKICSVTSVVVYGGA